MQRFFLILNLLFFSVGHLAPAAVSAGGKPPRPPGGRILGTVRARSAGKYGVQSPVRVFGRPGVGRRTSQVCDDGTGGVVGTGDEEKEVDPGTRRATRLSLGRGDMCRLWIEKAGKRGATREQRDALNAYRIYQKIVGHSIAVWAAQQDPMSDPDEILEEYCDEYAGEIASCTTQVAQLRELGKKDNFAAQAYYAAIKYLSEHKVLLFPASDTLSAQGTLTLSDLEKITEHIDCCPGLRALVAGTRILVSWNKREAGFLRDFYSLELALYQAPQAGKTWHEYLKKSIGRMSGEDLRACLFGAICEGDLKAYIDRTGEGEVESERLYLAASPEGGDLDGITGKSVGERLKLWRDKILSRK